MIRRSSWLLLLVPAAMLVAVTADSQDGYHENALCTACHDPHGMTANLDNIYELLETPNSGLRAVVFTDTTGSNSYADGDPVYDGVCEVCHTQTDYHRNDGSGIDSHYAGQDCMPCHPHSASFQPGPVTGVAAPVSLPAITAHPVPTRGAVTFEAVAAEGDGRFEVVVFDLLGRPVWRGETVSHGERAYLRWDGRFEDGRTAPPGVYFARVGSRAGRRTVKLIVTP
jgi:hypothetical protein